MLLLPHLNVPLNVPFFPKRPPLNKSLQCSNIAHYADIFILLLLTFSM